MCYENARIKKREMKEETFEAIMSENIPN